MMSYKRTDTETEKNRFQHIPVLGVPKATLNYLLLGGTLAPWARALWYLSVTTMYEPAYIVIEAGARSALILAILFVFNAKNLLALGLSIASAGLGAATYLVLDLNVRENLGVWFAALVAGFSIYYLARRRIDESGSNK